MTDAAKRRRTDAARRRRTAYIPVNDTDPIDTADPNIIDISFSDLTNHIDSADSADPYIPPPDENTFSDPTIPINSANPNIIDISFSDLTNPTDSADSADPYIPPPNENTFFDHTDPINSANPNTQPTNDAHGTAHDIYCSLPQMTKAVTPVQQLDISTFATQNTHGLRRIPQDTEGKTLPNEPHDYTRYEHLIAMMKNKNLDLHFVQETWLEGDVFD